MPEARVKHLEMIQAVVTRMASNGFLLKAWAVTLVVALLGVSATTKRGEVALIALVPLTAFWTLDGYFLCCERRFRALFDHARSVPNDQVDFSLSPAAFSSASGCSWRASALSAPTVGFYLPLAILCSAIGVLLFAT